MPIRHCYIQSFGVARLMDGCAHWRGTDKTRVWQGDVDDWNHDHEFEGNNNNWDDCEFLGHARYGGFFCPISVGKTISHNYFENTTNPAPYDNGDLASCLYYGLSDDELLWTGNRHIQPPNAPPVLYLSPVRSCIVAHNISTEGPGVVMRVGQVNWSNWYTGTTPALKVYGNGPAFPSFRNQPGVLLKSELTDYELSVNNLANLSGSGTGTFPLIFDATANEWCFQSTIDGIIWSPPVHPGNRTFVLTVVGRLPTTSPTAAVSYWDLVARVIAVSYSGTTVTVTTDRPHLRSTGDLISLSGIQSVNPIPGAADLDQCNGYQTLTGVPTTTSLTFTVPTAPDGSYAGGTTGVVSFQHGISVPGLTGIASTSVLGTAYISFALPAGVGTEGNLQIVFNNNHFSLCSATLTPVAPFETGGAIPFTDPNGALTTNKGLLSFDESTGRLILLNSGATYSILAANNYLALNGFLCVQVNGLNYNSVAQLLGSIDENGIRFIQALDTANGVTQSSVAKLSTGGAGGDWPGIEMLFHAGMSGSTPLYKASRIWMDTNNIIRFETDSTAHAEGSQSYTTQGDFDSAGAIDATITAGGLFHHTGSTVTLANPAAWTAALGISMIASEVAPDADNTWNLGDPYRYWANLYTYNPHFAGTTVSIGAATVAPFRTALAAAQSGLSAGSGGSQTMVPPTTSIATVGAAPATYSHAHSQSLATQLNLVIAALQASHNIGWNADGQITSHS